MTEGEHRVGVSFSPSGDARVDEIKRGTAKLIDGLAQIANDREHPGARCAALAMTEYEAAAMWAEKAVTKRAKD
ncbi:MAG: hypothetical protein HZY79_15585 [Rhodoblastus sp.]|nr:MAG: hypothetical protein HZY79_15585 [Rhodoblastus sp.]